VSFKVKFTAFLDSLLDEATYPIIAKKLRETPEDFFYEKGQWHSVEDLLAEHTHEQNLLDKYAFEELDPDFGGFSSGNLKACYVVDEDFINFGRAFVIFNLVGSNWVHVGQLNNQAEFWKLKE